MIDTVSYTFIASLLERRKVFCVGRFDKTYVGFDEIGVVSRVEELQSIDHSRVDAPVYALLSGSTACDHQSTNIATTMTTNGNGGKRVRFERRVGMIGFVLKVLTALEAVGNRSWA